jgi:hypothetical protein
MHEPPVGIGTHHVDIGASSEVVRVPRAHLEIDGHRRGPVDQVMTVACAFRKRSAIAWVQCSLAAIFDEHQLAFKQIDELVFVTVPVALTGPATRRQRHQIHAEIAKPTRIAQAPASGERQLSGTIPLICSHQSREKMDAIATLILASAPASNMSGPQHDPESLSP